MFVIRRAFRHGDLDTRESDYTVDDLPTKNVYKCEHNNILRDEKPLKASINLKLNNH
jgi:hypothetical protein